MPCWGSCSDFPLGDPLIFNEIMKVMMVKIIMIEMIKTMNEISSYIGLNDTFHRRRVDVRTSALEVGGFAGTMGSVQNFSHRVDDCCWDQGHRSNEEAS